MARWLRAHKDWWDKGLKNVPQQIAATLRDESFYTRAMSTDAAVVNFDPLAIAKPAYDRLGDLRQRGEDAYKRCFSQRAPQQPSFADATRQAQQLLAAAMGR